MALTITESAGFWIIEPAAKQADFAPHDLVSWVAQVSHVAERGNFLTHVTSTWGPGPLRGLDGFS